MKGAIFLIIAALANLSCSSMTPAAPENGGIYGWIIAGTDNARVATSLPADVSVALEETNDASVLFEAQATSYSGAFYFSDLAPGKYTITSNASGLTNGKVYDVEVSTDSLTYVIVYMEKVQEGRPGREGFVTIKVKSSDPNNKGSLEGTVNVDSSAPGEEVTIHIAGTMYSTETDTSGFFRLDGVIAGTYDIESTFRTSAIENEQYRLRGSAENVVIPKDSTSSIEIDLIKSFTGFHLN